MVRPMGQHDPTGVDASLPKQRKFKKTLRTRSKKTESIQTFNEKYFTEGRPGGGRR